MLSFEPEYRELHAAGMIDEAAAAQGIAAERGTVFSVSEELRVSLYAAVAAITTGVGIFLKANLHRIGPVSLIIALALVAAGCWGSAALVLAVAVDWYPRTPRRGVTSKKLVEDGQSWGSFRDGRFCGAHAQSGAAGGTAAR